MTYSNSVMSSGGLKLTDISSQIAKFMGPTWGPPGSCRLQMGPMSAPWTLSTIRGVIQMTYCGKPNSCRWDIPRTNTSGLLIASGSISSGWYNKIWVSHPNTLLEMISHLGELWEIHFAIRMTYTPPFLRYLNEISNSYNSRWLFSICAAFEKVLRRR